ncbi:MAG: hypothetical protein HZB46_03410, partial [Solirubrobacterales bacterium]|nr:hypothetical protein [Solirubrobacterales bacterium]
MEVRARIEGLQPGKRYFYRLVANNASGLVRTSGRSLVTPAFPSAATLVADRLTAPYAQAVKLTGRFSGPKIAGVTATLQSQAFPFTGPWNAIATFRSSSKGEYRFTLGSVTETTRVRVVAPGGATSRVLRIRSAIRLGIDSVRRRSGRVRFAGKAFPVTPKARATLQRR